ncbi:hypothetical protein [Arthrobacter glacialis]|uniref:hypothetical protein n=1 Tax=Arthrobacter glacialis TaxID=1664 RepID=UPI0010575C14|nr:hypothetical protein [Arthrobacter glacialis]
MNPEEPVDLTLLDTMPKQDRGETIAHIFATAAFSAIPFVGGSVAAVFSGVFAASEQARQEKWFREVAEAIMELKANRTIVWEEIFKDGRFHAAVAQGIRIVAETNRAEMRTAVAYAVSNSGSWSGNEEVVDRFLMKVLSRCESEHLLALQFFDNPHEFHRIHGDQLKEDTLTWIFTQVIYKDLVEWEPLAAAVLKDLYSYGLVIGNYGLGFELHATTLRQTTYIGHALLEFVSNRPSSDDETVSSSV